MTRTDTEFFRTTLQKNNVVLAPMAGVTDVSFRQMCLRHGALLMYTEMVSAKGLVYKNENTRYLMALSENEKATGVQIFGSDERFLSEAVKKYLNGSGFAFIDINMGCPVKKVVSNGEGSALLKDPSRVYSVARAVCDASEKPVSAKIRTGFDDSCINVTDNVKALCDAGVGMIAVHGRTREMFYSGKADYGLIADAVDAAEGIPVLANGDVTGHDSYRRIMTETGASGAMIGRAAMGNPFIFEEIAAYENGAGYAPPSPAEKLECALENLRLMKGVRDERTACCEFRKQLCWYTRGMEGGAAIRKRACSISTFDGFESYIKELQGQFRSG